MIPKTINIGPHTFKVELRKMDEHYGNFDMGKLQISIEKDIPQSLQEETLIHEILHGIQELTGTEQKEKQVQAQGVLFYQVIKQLCHNTTKKH